MGIFTLRNNLSQKENILSYKEICSNILKQKCILRVYFNIYEKGGYLIIHLSFIYQHYCTLIRFPENVQTIPYQISREVQALPSAHIPFLSDYLYRE